MSEESERLASLIDQFRIGPSAGEDGGGPTRVESRRDDMQEQVSASTFQAPEAAIPLPGQSLLLCAHWGRPSSTRRFSIAVATTPTRRFRLLCLVSRRLNLRRG